jgi:hypothetical protein
VDYNTPSRTVVFTVFVDSFRSLSRASNVEKQVTTVTNKGNFDLVCTRNYKSSAQTESTAK